jgi:hypothetical protein
LASWQHHRGDAAACVGQVEREGLVDVSGGVDGVAASQPVGDTAWLDQVDDEVTTARMDDVGLD